MRANEWSLKNVAVPLRLHLASGRTGCISRVVQVGGQERGPGTRTPSLSGPTLIVPGIGSVLSLPSTSSHPTHHLRSSSRLTSLCNSTLPLNSCKHFNPHHVLWYVITDVLHQKGSRAALVLFLSWKQGTLPRSFHTPPCIPHSAGLGNEMKTAIKLY